MPSLLEIYRDAAKDGCRIVLTGQCGNSTVSNGELDRILYEQYLHHRYFRVLACISHYGRHMKCSRKKILKILMKNFKNEKMKSKHEPYRLNQINSFLNPEIQDNYPLQERFTAGEMYRSNITIPDGSEYRKSIYSKSMFSYLGEIETKMGLYCGVILRDPTRDPRILNFCYYLPYHYFAYKGTPRWLIRSTFQGLLPAKLLENWERYGLQNADWLQRLERDWDEIYPELCKKLRAPEVKKYICQDNLEQFLKKYREKQPLPSDFTVQYALFLYTLSAFLSDFYN